MAHTDSRLQQELEVDAPAQDLLLNNFLSLGESKTGLKDKSAIKVATDLASVGVLTGDANANEFWVPSPLIRAIIWSTLSIDELTVPLPITNGLLDVVTAIKIGLPLFNRATVIRAPAVAFKQNRDSGTVVKHKDPVPNEHVYHVQLLLLLHKWLKGIHQWQVDSEVNSGRDSFSHLFSFLSHSSFNLLFSNYLSFLLQTFHSPHVFPAIKVEPNLAQTLLLSFETIKLKRTKC